jgi:hypothetical protein
VNSSLTVLSRRHGLSPAWASNYKHLNHQPSHE